MSYRRQDEAKVWRWRVRGRSFDSRMVTLGRYDTETEARAEHSRIMKEGLYPNAIVEQLKPAPGVPVQEG